MAPETANQAINLSSARPEGIIVAQADAGQRKALVGLLRELGFRNVTEASDGSQAWKMMAQRQASLVIADWNMPDMSGMALLRIMRADSRYASIPVILLTDNITKAQVIEAGEAGVSGILLIPLTISHLRQKLEIVLGEEKDPVMLQAEHLYQQGLELMQSGCWEEALVHFQQVIEVHENAEVYYNMGYIKTAQGRYEEAIQYFRRATQINADFARAYERMGECYMKLNRPRLAQQTFQKAAEILMEKEMDEHAESVLLQVLNINPNTINVYNSLGIIYRRQNKFDKAIDQYKKALKVNPSDENILYNLGRIYYEDDQMDKAAQILRQALQINPLFSEAQDMLSVIVRHLKAEEGE